MLGLNLSLLGHLCPWDAIFKVLLILLRKTGRLDVPRLREMLFLKVDKTM